MSAVAKPNQILQRLHIEGYRSFASFDFEDLAPINLIVGPNNSGKTSVLEVLSIYDSESPLLALANTCRRRGEVQDESFETFSATKRRAVLLQNAFFAYGDNYLRLAIGDRPNQITISSPGSSAGRTFTERRGDVAKSFGTWEDGSVQEDKLGELGSLSGIAPILTTNGLGDQALRRMLGSLIKSGLEGFVVQALQLIDPAVTSLHLIPEEVPTGFARSVFVERNGTRMRLGTLGEGMERILSVAVALSANHGRFALIDEIDTGLHYTILPKVWALIAEAQEKFGVQVFATTHSEDCLKGLADYLEANPAKAEQFAIHKLDRRLPKAVTLKGEELSTVLENSIEVR